MGYDLELSGTAEECFNFGRSRMSSGDYDKAIELFSKAYYEFTDEEMKSKCQKYIDECQKYIDEETKQREEALKNFQTGQNYLNNAKIDRSISGFETAKYYFGKAYDHAFDSEFEKDCLEGIRECDNWIDSILYRND